MSRKNNFVLYEEYACIIRNHYDVKARMQLDAINIALAELQAKPKEEKLRRRIGFIQVDKSQKESRCKA